VALPLLVAAFRMFPQEAPVIGSKPAPVRMMHFIAEVLGELPVRGKVVSVEVDDGSYLVTLALADGGLRVQHLSAWDVSRSLRGDPEALAALRAGLLRDAG